MKPNTTIYLLSFVAAMMSAGLAYQTGMVFAHGGGNIPNALSFIAAVWIFECSVLKMPRLTAQR